MGEVQHLECFQRKYLTVFLAVCMGTEGYWGGVGPRAQGGHPMYREAIKAAAMETGNVSPGTPPLSFPAGSCRGQSQGKHLGAQNTVRITGQDKRRQGHHGACMYFNYSGD